MSEVDIQLHKVIRKAIKLGDLSTVSNLLSEEQTRLSWNIPPFGTWLHVAAAHGQTHILEWLIQQKMDVNLKAGVAKSGPIDAAASNGHPETVRCLLDKGAILDVSNSVGNPLFGAIHGGHTEIAKLLLDAGIDFRVKYTGANMQNMDALAFAREWGRTDIAALLEAKLAESAENV